MSATTDTPAQISTAPTTSARPPVAAPAASGVAVVLAVAVIGLGVVALRDVLIAAGAIAGVPWIVSALNYLDGLRVQNWTLVAGVGVAVLGVLLVGSAAKPRRRTHLPLSVPGTWITARDIARLASSSARSITGVAAASAGGSGRKITLTVTVMAGYDAALIKDAAHATVTKALAPMARLPRVRVRIKEVERL